MDLKQYLSELAPAERDIFAKQCRTSAGHLRNVAYGDRTASTELAVCIERESGGEVTRIEMFPDSFADKWPELVNSKPKQPPAQSSPALAATETVAQGVA